MRGEEKMSGEEWIGEQRHGEKRRGDRDNKNTVQVLQVYMWKHDRLTSREMVNRDYTVVLVLTPLHSKTCIFLWFYNRV